MTCMQVNIIWTFIIGVVGVWRKVWSGDANTRESKMMLLELAQHVMWTRTARDYTKVVTWVTMNTDITDTVSVTMTNIAIFLVSLLTTFIIKLIDWWRLWPKNNFETKMNDLCLPCEVQESHRLIFSWGWWACALVEQCARAQETRTHRTF